MPTLEQRAEPTGRMAGSPLSGQARSRPVTARALIFGGWTVPADGFEGTRRMSVQVHARVTV
jgi:hypothetical protein